MSVGENAFLLRILWQHRIFHPARRKGPLISKPGQTPLGRRRGTKPKVRYAKFCIIDISNPEVKTMKLNRMLSVSSLFIAHSDYFSFRREHSGNSRRARNDAGLYRLGSTISSR